MLNSDTKPVPEFQGPLCPNIDMDRFNRLIDELNGLLDDMVRLEASSKSLLQNIHPEYVDSARNLIHYLAMRQRDYRDLQDDLADIGLSSLGRAESHVMYNVSSVLNILYKLADRNRCSVVSQPRIGYEEGGTLLEEHAMTLLGPVPEGRRTRIMVTMPGTAAQEYELVKDLISSGMDVMRINCAHDDPGTWSKMIANLRRAERELGSKCKVFMDLAGHKLRSGPIETLSQVVRWGPKEDISGKVTAPARVWIKPAEHDVPPPLIVDACIPVPDGWLSAIEVGDRIEFTDTRGKSRKLEIVASVGDCRIGESYKKTFVSCGTVLTHIPDKRNAQSSKATIGEIPIKEKFILLKKGDTLILTNDENPGQPPVYDEAGNIVKPATIGVSLSRIFTRVKPGERIWLDDGKIGGVIRSVTKKYIHVEVTHARFKGDKLRSGKGINLPDSDLDLPPLTRKDISDLKFIADNADAVCFSFVDSAADVNELRSRLEKLGGKTPGIVLKIETVRAFEHMPELLLASMQSPSVGVMIARGDLAVEVGYERMAEVQEEILWVCEAAHLPVIWATEVLDKLAKRGMPSRAEITDTAMGVRAECVMLNKGPYIEDALATLDDILRRMQAHQSKKNSRLRQLKLAHNIRLC